MNRKTKNHRLLYGFTLIELLAAAAIIGVLVTLAMPRYKAFIARSRQAEAKNNLGIIRTLQEAYFMRQAALDKGKYHTGLNLGAQSTSCADILKKNDLGFRLTDCGKAYYTYTTAATPNGGGIATSTTARPVYPGCTQTDKWTMTEVGTLQNSATDDVVAKCKD